MEQYAAPLVFGAAIFWFAFFSKESKGMRIWMCISCALLLWWLKT